MEPETTWLSSRGVGYGLLRALPGRDLAYSLLSPQRAPGNCETPGHWGVRINMTLPSAICHVR